MTDSNRTPGQQLADRYGRYLTRSAELKNDADKAAALAKRVFREVVNFTEGKSHAEKEAKAALHVKFIAAEDAALEAASKANIARAHTDAAEIEWRTWQSEQATERAKMELR